MKVLLIKDVKSLGKVGEVKEVKDGYGKNFLIGKGFAKHATPEVLKQWEEEQAIKKENLEKEIQLCNEQKQMIESLKVTIKHKVGGNGHLIGSITNKEISKALKDEFKLDIDKKSINVKNPIKTPGIFKVECKLGHSINCELTVDVIAS